MKKIINNVVYGVCLFFCCRDSFCDCEGLFNVMASTRGQRAQNQPSKLLTETENQKLFDLLGHRSVVRVDKFAYIRKLGYQSK